MPEEQRAGSILVLNILNFFFQCLSFGFDVQSHRGALIPPQQKVNYVLEFRARVSLVNSAGN